MRESLDVSLDTTHSQGCLPVLSSRKRMNLFSTFTLFPPQIGGNSMSTWGRKKISSDVKSPDGDRLVHFLDTVAAPLLGIPTSCFARDRHAYSNTFQSAHYGEWEIFDLVWGKQSYRSRRHRDPITSLVGTPLQVITWPACIDRLTVGRCEGRPVPSRESDACAESGRSSARHLRSLHQFVLHGSQHLEGRNAWKIRGVPRSRNSEGQLFAVDDERNL